MVQVGLKLLLHAKEANARKDLTLILLILLRMHPLCESHNIIFDWLLFNQTWQSSLTALPPTHIYSSSIGSQLLLIHVFVLQNEEREIFHPLNTSSNGCNSHDRASQSPGATISIQIFHTHTTHTEKGLPDLMSDPFPICNKTVYCFSHWLL